MRIPTARRAAIALLKIALAVFLLWIVAVPEARQTGPNILSAQAPLSYCFNGSQPPNLSTTATGILNQAGNQFVSNYNQLSQAAWCSFVALNWAAAGNGSPTMNPNPGQPLGTCANQGTAACSLVWETWRNSTEVYTAKPLPCSSGVPEPRQHLLRVGSPDFAVVNPHAPGQFMRPPATLLPGKAQAISQPTSIYQATGFVLPDVNNTASNPSVILYEVRENPSACTTITTSITVPGTSASGALNTSGGELALYNGAVTAKLVPQPPPGFIQFQGSAFEVKPSWYQFPSSGPTPAQLGMISATGAKNGGGTFTVGLTGFHIIWKVFSGSNWMWMTFEYAGSNQYTQPYLLKGQPATAYFTPTLVSALNYNEPGGNNQYNCPSACAFNSSTKACACPAITQPAPVPCTTNTSSNLTSPAPCNPVGSAAATANNLFHQLVKGTPLANYNLVGVQVVPTLNNINTLLANNQIETDIGSNLSNPYNPSSSCITCHYMASIGTCNNNNGSPYLNRIGTTKPVSQQPGAFAYQGYAGAFPSATYSSANGPYLSTDFVWSVVESSFAQGTTSCPTSSAAK
jgi:hypothetical protein